MEWKWSGSGVGVEWSGVEVEWSGKNDGEARFFSEVKTICFIRLNS